MLNKLQAPYGARTVVFPLIHEGILPSSREDEFLNMLHEESVTFDRSLPRYSCLDE